MTRAPVSSRALAAARPLLLPLALLGPTACGAANSDEVATPSATTGASVAAPLESSTPVVEIPDPMPIAIESALPTLEGLAEIAGTVKAPSSTWDLWEIVPTAQRPSAEAPIAVFTVSLAKDQRVSWPADPAVDVLGVVVEGAVKLHALDDKSGGSPLAVWQGFRAPEGNLELVNTGKTRARVVVAVAMNPAGAPLLAHLPTKQPERPNPKGMFDRSPAAPTAPPRTKRVDVIDFPTRRLLTWGAGAYHVRIGFEGSTYDYKGPDGKAAPVAVNDAPPAVMDAMIMSKDAPVAAHVHEKEWECIVALVADGDLLVADSPTATPSPIPIEDGSVHCVPPGKPHQWKPRGSKPFVAIQLYAAPGPEQRFKKLAASEQP